MRVEGGHTHSIFTELSIDGCKDTENGCALSPINHHCMEMENRTSMNDSVRCYRDQLMLNVDLPKKESDNVEWR